MRLIILSKVAQRQNWTTVLDGAQYCAYISNVQLEMLFNFLSSPALQSRYLVLKVTVFFQRDVPEADICGFDRNISATIGHSSVENRDVKSISTMAAHS